MRIYVGNLPYTTTRADLEDMFGAYGTVTDTFVVTDRETGRSRGFAFVEMAGDAEGRKAIEGLNGKDMDGRSLRVNEARPREQDGGSRFGGA